MRTLTWLTLGLLVGLLRRTQPARPASIRPASTPTWSQRWALVCIDLDNVNTERAVKIATAARGKADRVVAAGNFRSLSSEGLHHLRQVGVELIPAAGKDTADAVLIYEAGRVATDGQVLFVSSDTLFSRLVSTVAPAGGLAWVTPTSLAENTAVLGLGRLGPTPAFAPQGVPRREATAALHQLLVRRVSQGPVRLSVLGNDTSVQQLLAASEHGRLAAAVRATPGLAIDAVSGNVTLGA